MESLKPAIGSIKNKKRVGRGPGSGIGKTCTRGHKGQKSRKGGTIRLGFEGGQTPLYRRLPKKGFKNSKFARKYKEVNLFMLDTFKDGSVINIDDYIKHGMLNSKKGKIKILGSGELTKKLEVYADKFTKGAKEKIEKAGGKINIIEQQKPEKQKIKEQKPKRKKIEGKKNEEKNLKEQKKENK